MEAMIETLGNPFMPSGSQEPGPGKAGRRAAGP